jgi:hypothetical protein
MKRLLSATAIVVAGIWFAAPDAHAGPTLGDIVDVTGYDLPDNASFNSVTTNGYSYYTGPITLHIADPVAGNRHDLLVYCADLNHTLHAGSYRFELLESDGAGNALDQTLSNHLGQLAAIGLATDLATTGGQYFATAVQAAIWHDEYTTPTTLASTTFTAPGGQINLDYDDLQNTVASWKTGGPRALALVPYDQGWWQTDGASQQMIVGQLSNVPEPMTATLLGAGIIGLGLVRRRRSLQPGTRLGRSPEPSVRLGSMATGG